MPTRLRTVYITATGTPSGGGMARKNLEGIYGKFAKVPARGSVPEAKRLVQMYEAIPLSARGTLFLFREPRTVAFTRSRWKQMCKYFGIAPRKKKGVALNAVRLRAPMPDRPFRRPRQPAQPVARDRGDRIPAPGADRVFAWPVEPRFAGVFPARAVAEAGQPGGGMPRMGDEVVGPFGAAQPRPPDGFLERLARQVALEQAPRPQMVWDDIVPEPPDEGI